MKFRIGTLISVASGIALTLFAVHTSPRLANWITGSTPQRSVATKKSSLRLSKGEMLVMESDSGVAVIELTDFNERSAAYRWRSYATRGNVVEQGHGMLTERYASTESSPGKFGLVDQGSDLHVAGPFRIEWSYADFQSGWLYVDQAHWRVHVAPSVAFDSYRLSN